jgi:hypothetical protein
MGQISTITLVDSLAVNKVYIPQQINGDVATWQDKSASASKLFGPLGLSLSSANGKSAVNRSKLTLAIPYEVTENEITSVATMRAQVEYILPDSCSQLQRENLHALVISALGNTLVEDTMVNLNHVF